MTSICTKLIRSSGAILSCSALRDLLLLRAFKLLWATRGIRFAFWLAFGSTLFLLLSKRPSSTATLASVATIEVSSSKLSFVYLLSALATRTELSSCNAEAVICFSFLIDPNKASKPRLAANPRFFAMIPYPLTLQ